MTWQIILIDFYIILLVISLVNYLFRSPIKVSGSEPTNDLVSILIPARNEEENLPQLLNSLMNQTYPLIEIIVFNDLSDDKTEEIVNSYAEKDSRIKLINSTGLPDGWLGKNFACHQLGLAAKGKFLLFVDADVQLEPKVIERFLTYGQQEKLALVSVFPNQEMIMLGEQATVPIMNQILLSLLPLPLVRLLPFSSLAAANGQFMFFDAGIYRDEEPHKMFRTEKVEDIQIARYLKKLGHRIACLASEADIKCRMYAGSQEAVRGFSRNIHHYFGGSHLLAFFYWAIHIIIPILFIVTDQNLYFLLIVVLIVLRRSLNSLTSNQSVWINNRLAFIQHIYFAIILYHSFIQTRKKSFTWKGRSIS